MKGQNSSNYKIYQLFGDSSGFLVLGFCLDLIALSFNLIGFATPYWVKATSTNSMTYIFGLWKFCKKPKDVQFCEDLQKAKDWFRIIQGTASVGFGCLFFASLLLFIYIFILRKGNELVVSSCICLTVIAAVFNCITIMVFGGAKMEDMLSLGDVALTEHFHFSYGFVATGMIICTVAAVSLVFDFKYG